MRFLSVVLGALLCVLSAGVFPALMSSADVCHVQRAVVGHNVHYSAPVVQSYSNFSQIYPQVIAVPVQSEYYYSINDHYRDKLLLDAIKNEVQKINETNKDQYIKTLELLLKLKGGGAVVPPNADGSIVPEEVNDNPLAVAVSQHCIKCHNDRVSKGSLSLTNLDKIDSLTRWKMHSMVCAGTMPPAPARVVDNNVKALFYKYASGSN